MTESEAQKKGQLISVKAGGCSVIITENTKGDFDAKKLSDQKKKDIVISEFSVSHKEHKEPETEKPEEETNKKK